MRLMTARPVAIAIAVLSSRSLFDGTVAFAHGNHGAGSAGVAHAGAGIAAIEPDDSLKLSVDIFGYFAASLASGWRTGEPLGAGGKIPLFYNQALHREGPFERSDLVKKDYWPQYRDFSYNPLWIPSQLGLRTQYRFIPSVQGTVTAVYFGSLDRATLEPNPIELDELFISWQPQNVPGLTLSVGRLFLVGTYSVPFDQFPLESFQVNGATLSYERPLASLSMRGQLTGGRAPLGRTTAVERATVDPALDRPFLDGVRERTHLYATAVIATAGGFSVGVLGGYQRLPADETTTNDLAPLTHRWPAADGWQAGVEAGLSLGRFDQYLVVSHGSGDVEMAWGAPDYVYVEHPAVRQSRLIRAGSSLSQVVYWAAVGGPHFQIVGGAWGQWRRPARLPQSWKIFDDATLQEVTLNLLPQDFRAAKFNLLPTYSRGPFTIGVRLDGIRYLDKRATTNTIERLTDEALRPILVEGGSTMIETQLVGPSRWEREAVDNLIVSPLAEVRIGKVVRLRGAWSGAWYSKPVHRQRAASQFHANLTLSILLIHRFADEDHDQP
jgi:hypothetical protein